MKSGPFIALVSETFGLDPKTVSFAARMLREAGYITTGARGVNAPHMTARDAARLSLALLTGEGPTRIVSAFEHYRAMTLDEELSGAPIGLMTVCDLPEGHTIEDLLTWIFSLWQTPEKLDPFTFDVFGTTYDPVFSIALIESKRMVKITVKTNAGTGEYFYRDNAGWAELHRLMEDYRAAYEKQDFEAAQAFLDRHTSLIGQSLAGGGMRVTREICTPEIAPIAQAIAGGEQ